MATAASAKSRRDWNEEYYQVLQSDPLHRGQKLHELSLEFMSVASALGQVIIKERHLPLSKKTIKPLSCLGIAGGEKYLHESIFFKYAVDKNHLFGSDEFAMKVAGHELKGQTAMVSCGMIHGLNFGLMTIIDYRGYRLLATSSLPISHETLVYGSGDGGQTVHADLSEMNHLIKQCAAVLNLKGHVAGVNNEPDKNRFLYGPYDIEGHLGHDGRLYVVDLARLFPPESPSRDKPGAFLYQLLRPELVSRFRCPLSSDAFTLFGHTDNKVHDSEVHEATRYLHDKVIPDFARTLTQLDAKDDQDLRHAMLLAKELAASSMPLTLSMEIANCTTSRRSIEWLIEDLHRAGINSMSLSPPLIASVKAARTNSQFLSLSLSLSSSASRLCTPIDDATN